MGMGAVTVQRLTALVCAAVLTGLAVPDAQARTQKPALHGEKMQVGVEQRTEAIVLIKAVDRQKDRVNRQGEKREGQA